MIEFVHPIWLAGLGAMAAPVLLHLLGRRATPPQFFPPAVLLGQGGARRVSRRRIKELLQLFLRMALLAAVVLAYARPLLPDSGAGGAVSTVPTGLVLVIDDSVSMSRPAFPGTVSATGASVTSGQRGQTSAARAASGGETRLEEALRQAVLALRRLGNDSEAAVVFASGKSRGPMRPLQLERELLAAGTEAQVSAGADLARALGAVPAFLEEMEPLVPAVLVFSDCESGAVDAAGLKALRKTAGVALVDVGRPGNGDDWGLVAARLDRGRLVGGDEAQMLVRVVRSSGEGSVAARRLELVLGGVAVSWQTVRLPPGGEAEIALRFSVEAGAHLGEVRLTGSDPWEINDNLPVALVAQGAARVAVICSQARLSTCGRAVCLALAAGPGEERKAFVAEGLAADSARAADLSRFSALVLVGPPALKTDMSSRLARRVAGGAGLVILADDAGALEGIAVPLGMPVPPSSGRPVDFARGARLVPDRAGGALFTDFRRALSESVFRRALSIDARSGTVLARLKSGDRELPGLVERHLGRGLVLTLASSTARRWSRLTGRDQAGLFVPLMHELVARAAGLVRAEHLAAPDGAVQLAISARERGARLWLYRGPGLRLPLGSPGERLEMHLAAPAAPGAYTILSELNAHRLALRPLSVRLGPGELRGLREEELGRFTNLSAGAPALGKVASSAVRGVELSPYLAAVGLLLMMAEAIVSFRVIGKPARGGEDISGRQKRGRAGA